MRKGGTAILMRKRLGQRLDTYPMCRIPVKCAVVLPRVADNAAPCEMSPKYVEMAQTISEVPSIISVFRRDRPNRDCAELAGCGNMLSCCHYLIEGYVAAGSDSCGCVCTMATELTRSAARLLG